ncbi:MAG TPA: hypothetical protein VE673_08050, partial [Pseudonocardiaceae bacterium]|nr:hypothetical protein [Pseudonocardiaceae bacterium]
MPVVEDGRRFTATDTFRAAHRLQELRHWTDQLWQSTDLLIMPTVPTTFTIDDIAESPLRRNTVLGRFTQFVNLLDLAAVTVPAGLNRGWAASQRHVDRSRVLRTPAAVRRNPVDRPV